MTDKQILDATCGGRSIWHPKNKDRKDTLYIDKREKQPGFTGQEGRTLSIEPDEVQDFRNLPYEDETFKLVIFDPPHVIKENGMKNLSGYVEKSYGALDAETWQHDLKQGFEELFRVLETGGTLVFKFADNAADFKEVLDLAPVDPLLGTMTKKTSSCENRWFVFQKTGEVSPQ
jgi:hypothetical protein